jgi:hypothetical protein
MALVSPEIAYAPPPTGFRLVARRFARHRLAVVALGVLILLVLGVLVGPALSPYAFDANDLAHAADGTWTLAHPLGTDELGRDVLTRLLYAGRISLAVGLAVASLSVAVGTLVGAFSAYLGGWFDGLAMRLVDVIQSVPLLMLLMVLVASATTRADVLVSRSPADRGGGWCAAIRPRADSWRRRCGMGPRPFRHLIQRAAPVLVVATRVRCHHPESASTSRHPRCRGWATATDAGVPDHLALAHIYPPADLPRRCDQLLVGRRRADPKIAPEWLRLIGGIVPHRREDAAGHHAHGQHEGHHAARSGDQRAWAIPPPVNQQLCVHAVTSVASSRMNTEGTGQAAGGGGPLIGGVGGQDGRLFHPPVAGGTAV